MGLDRQAEPRNRGGRILEGLACLDASPELVPDRATDLDEAFALLVFDKIGANADRDLREERPARRQGFLPEKNGGTGRRRRRLLPHIPQELWMLILAEYFI